MSVPVATGPRRPSLWRLLPDNRVARLLMASSFVGSFGYGAFSAGSAVFFLRYVGLQPRQIAAGMTAAAIVSAAGLLMVGRLADRYGSRVTVVVISLVQATLIACYSIVHTFAVFVPILCLSALAERCGSAVRNALVALVLGERERLRARAYQRASFNLGMSLGAVAAAVPLSLDTRAGYLCLVGLNATTAVLTVPITLLLPHVTSRTSASGREWPALTDLRYIAVSVLSGLLSIHHSILTVALPIWIVTHSSAPRALISGLFVLNTVVVIGLQVPLSRAAESLPGATRLARRGALTLAAACPIFGAAGYLPSMGTVTLCTVGVLALTMAEMWIGAGTWCLSYELAEPQAQAQYQTTFALGMTAEAVVGPFLGLTVAAGLGLWGWTALATYFVLLALLICPSVERFPRANRRRTGWPGCGSTAQSRPEQPGRSTS